MDGRRRLLHPRALLVVLAVLALVLASCGGEDSGDEAPASTPTGIAEIDAIIDAVERQDVEALLGFVKYQRIDCESPTSDGYILPPTCPEDVLQGTTVDAFLAGSCHPGWMRPVEVADAIDWVGDRRLVTHAVLRGGEPFGEIEADYRVVLSSATDLDVEGLSSQLGISGGGVVWLTGWCDSALGQIEYLQETGAELIYLALTAPIDTPAAAPSMLNLPAIISDFLVIEGSEHFPAIPPCTGFQAEDRETEESPLSIGFVPGEVVETQSIVSFCPDGTILGALKVFEFPDEPGRELHVFYTRAPYSYPIVLALPSFQRIEAVEINGQRGLLLVPERELEIVEIASVRFWVEEQVDQKAGAYVHVSLSSDTPDVASKLIEIAESITVDDPTDSSP